MMRWIGVLILPVLMIAGTLGVDEAFRPSAKIDGTHIRFSIDIADHVHLSKEGLKFSVAPADKVSLKRYVLPQGQKDEFGDEVYTGHFQVDLPLEVKEGAR